MNYLYFYLLLLKKEEDEKFHRAEKPKHSRYRKDFLRRLSVEESRRRQRRIPRIALQDPSKSSWRTLYDSRNDQALITLTGLDVETFHYVLRKFAPICDQYSPFIDDEGRIVKKKSNAGRPRLLHPEDILALNLAWTRTQGSTMALQMIFGTTMTPVSKYLRFGRRIFVEVFQHDEYAEVRLPSPREIEEYKAVIKERHINLEDVWTTMDGLKLYLQQANNIVIQARYYNGWTHDHYVTNVFCFCPDGTIPIAFFNVPGSVHDSQVADWGNVYDKLEFVYQKTGGKCTVDSAFGRIQREFLIKSSPDSLVGSGRTREEVIHQVRIGRDAISMRQASEWGMRTLQSSFPRLKDRFIYEENGERRIMLQMIVLLFNLRARLVGINQIRNTYMPYLMEDANLHYVHPLL
jgi:hypothetical protein